MLKGLVTVLFSGALILLTESQEIRVDQFDKNGQRQGYYIINPQTGKVYQFDKHSNRIGSGQITQPKPSTTPTTPQTPKK